MNTKQCDRVAIQEELELQRQVEEDLNREHDAFARTNMEEGYDEEIRQLIIDGREWITNKNYSLEEYVELINELDPPLDRFERLRFESRKQFLELRETDLIPAGVDYNDYSD